MNKKIKIENFIERLNNFDFEKGTKFKFLDKIYLYDYPNLVGVYEIGKPTKPEYSIFAQFDMTNLHCEVEIIEEDKPIQDLHLRNEKGEVLIGANMFSIEYKINELVKEINKLKKTINKITGTDKTIEEIKKEIDKLKEN